MVFTVCGSAVQVTDEFYAIPTLKFPIHEPLTRELSDHCLTYEQYVVGLGYDASIKHIRLIAREDLRTGKIYQHLEGISWILDAGCQIWL